MKSIFLCLAMIGASQACFAQPYFDLRHATAAETKLELSAGKLEYPRYEPVRLHLKMIFLGVVDSGQVDQRLARNLTLFTNLRIRGPVPAPYENPATCGLEQMMPEDSPLSGRAALAGDSLEADFWIFPLALLSAPGEYELWMEGKECCWQNRPYESNHVRITVVEPQGKEKEALDFIKGPERLLALMGGPTGPLLPTSDKSKALYGHPVYTLTELMPFWQDFVHKSEGSAYHPFALFALSRAYFLGWTETGKKESGLKYMYSREPDYELLLQAADEFLRLYPSHSFASEEHLFRLVALYGLGKKDEAAKEFATIHEKLDPLEKTLTEEFRRNGGFESEEGRFKETLEECKPRNEGTLYILGAAKKLKTLYETDMLPWGKRHKDARVTYWPVQTQELNDVFQSRWRPR